ncbi:MAG: fibronectin type III domain-containing protein, partial [Candidatus Saccharibacteria bacterium]
SVVEFQPEGGKVQEAVKTKLETKHEITLSGLFDNTYYLIKAIGVDQYGNQVVSDTNRVKTDFDTRPPVLANVAIEVSNTDFGVSAKSQVVISWETDEPSTSQVEYDYGVTGDTYGIKSQEDSTLTTSHVFVLTDLRPSSSYHLRAVSRDASGNSGHSDDQSILTEQARSSVLDMIISSIQSSLGWLFGMGK